MANKGLGKGLEALISGISQDEKENIQEVSLAELRPNPYQPRKQFQEESLQELANSIREHGIVQPLVVRKSIHGYEIVTGERRFRAAKLANLDQVPIVIRDCSDDQMMEIALIENLQREDLNPIEIATAYRKLMDHFSLTQEELAQRVGKSRPHVANFLRLLQLPMDIQEDVSRGTISMGHARTLLAVESLEIQRQLAKKVVEEGISVRELEALVQQMQEGGKKRKEKRQPKPITPMMRQYEEYLQQILETPVKIKQGRRKGKIEIEYYSEQELERIVDFLYQKRGIE